MEKLKKNNGIIDNNINKENTQLVEQAKIRLVSDAIKDIKGLIFDPQVKSKIFDILLKYVYQITDSTCGTCLIINPIHIDANSLKHACVDASLVTDTETYFTNEKTFLHWVSQALVPLKATIFNDEFPDNQNITLSDNQDASSLLFLPIVSQNKLRAIFILAKSFGEYEANILNHLMPLLGAITSTLKSVESIKSNAVGFEQMKTNHRYLDNLFSLSPIAVVVVANDKKILTHNSAAELMFSPESANEDINLFPLLKMCLIEKLIPIYAQLSEKNNQEALQGKLLEEVTAYKLDGSPFIINLTAFRYVHGDQLYTTLQIQDITAMRESAEVYKQTSQQLNALSHLVPVGIVRVDGSWNCIFSNDKWHEFSGLSHEECEGSHWINAIHSADIKFVLNDLRESLVNGNDYNKEIRLVTPLGQIRWVDFNTRILFDENGNVDGFLGTFADITERLIYQQKLRHIAEYDTLTNLANRNLLHERIQHAFHRSARDDSHIALFFIDLDGFKDVNDTLGHAAGDMLLKQVAERLTSTLRKNDTVARFGGDEFVVLLDHYEHINDITVIADKVIEIIAKPYQLGEHEVYITTSLGIAEGKSDNSSVEQILKEADSALYLAKKEGKNKFQLYNSKLNEETKNKHSLVNQLRNGIKQQRYFLQYQPIANVNHQESIGFEALIRFIDHHEKIIEPNQFIPILEETGMIVDTGHWVIEEVCCQINLWRKAGQFPKNGFVAFNVSPKQLFDDSLLNVIKQACKKYDIAPHSLRMEVTESVFIDKPKKVNNILRSIKDFGIRLSLDDFGTGYSSLSYLQNYEFDLIKIDKSFVNNLSSDSSNAKIMKVIIALANSMNITVTVEGVETLQSLEFIKQLGAEYFQGYFLSKPVSPKEAINFIDGVIEHS